MSFQKRQRLNPVSEHNRSSLHIAARQLIKSAYPGFRVIEEEPMQVTVSGGRRTLYVDFLLPDLKFAVEVHGRQHDTYVPHMHGDQEGFKASKIRDRAKAQVLKEAGYALIVLRQKDLEMTRLAFMQMVQNSLKEMNS